eukprot:5108914-Pyramimonas_sp.AAC.1
MLLALALSFDDKRRRRQPSVNSSLPSVNSPRPLVNSSLPLVNSPRQRQPSGVGPLHVRSPRVRA